MSSQTAKPATETPRQPDSSNPDRAAALDTTAGATTRSALDATSGATSDAAPDTTPGTPPDGPPVSTPPTVRRRLATMLYEAVILFGIVFIAAYLFSTLTQQRNGLTHHNLLAGWIGLVLAGYFVWCWTHGGQTLPMKTWRLRVVTAHDAPLTVPRAVARYVLAWLWFLPPLALHPLFGIGVPQTLIAAVVWFVLWAATGRIGPSRRFLHDRLAGTKIVAVSPRR